MLQQIALGGTMIVLPIYLQMVLEYNALKAGLSLAPRSPLASLTWQPRRGRTFLMAGGAQVTLNRAGLVSAL
jgi:hypothetical protein